MKKIYLYFVNLQNTPIEKILKLIDELIYEGIPFEEKNKILYFDLNQIDELLNVLRSHGLESLLTRS